MNTAKIDISTELESLQRAIASLPKHILLDKGDISLRSSTPDSSAVDIGQSTPTGPVPPPKPRFARLRSSFRRLSTKSTPRSSEIPLLSETSPHISPSSPASMGPSIKGEDDTATLLLALLAPLVARLQKLGCKVQALQNVEEETEIYDLFSGCCRDLGARVEGYKYSTADVRADPHDLEMKTLLLGALRKKVELEQEKLDKAVFLARQAALIQSSSPRPSTDEGKRADGADENENENPLILHSTGVLSTHRRSVTPLSQPIGIGIGIGNTASHMGKYPSFTNAGQQTGLSNVFRLGSFQNSLLFSPSPVAVRRPAVAEPLKV